VLTFDGITVEDWVNGGTVEGGEAEEEIWAKLKVERSKMKVYE
jgi:hypothetical protein